MTKVIEFGTIFLSKKGMLLPSKCTCFIVRNKSVQRNYEHCFKDFMQKFSLYELIH